MVEIRAAKRALRTEARRRILAMDPDDRRRQEEGLRRRFAELPGFAGAQTVLLYAAAFPEEFATGPMLDLALALGKRLACPRVDRRAGLLRLHEIRDRAADLRPGVLGIPEPAEGCPLVEPAAIDWVLVPGLAFDPRGYRLGRGAGHYDRLLATLRPEAPRWALALDPQWVDAVPVEPHDQRLDGVAGAGRTATRVIDTPQEF